ERAHAGRRGASRVPPGAPRVGRGPCRGPPRRPMSPFFAYLSRMKFIRRWGLMHSTYPENVQEHSLRVAQIAHALAIVRNRVFGGGVTPSAPPCSRCTTT